jgi:hypothetical protein
MDLSNLYESVGNVSAQLTNLRKAQAIYVYTTQKSTIASLKKCQYFNNIKEDLGILPQELTKDEGLAQEEAEKGLERANLAYFLISLTQANLDKSLDYLTQPDLKYNVYSEFTSKRDLSYYTVLILLRLGDYDTFKV